MDLLFYLCLALLVPSPLSLSVAAQGQGPSSAFQQQCLSFAPEKLVRNSTRTQLEYVTNGMTLEFPDNVASCARPSQLVSTNLCRIALSIPTSNRSSLTFELWLPEEWPSTRYVSTGNGGIDGCRCFSSRSRSRVTNNLLSRHQIRGSCLHDGQRLCCHGDQQRSQWHHWDHVPRQPRYCGGLLPQGVRPSNPFC